MVLVFLWAIGISLVLGMVGIPLLRRLKFGQQVRDDGPQQHLSKQGTPTMGGLIMICAVLIAAFVFMRGKNSYALMTLLLMSGFGLIGFLDDFIKIRKKRSLGLRAYQKIVMQVVLAGFVAWTAYSDPRIGSIIMIPFANIRLDIGIFYLPLVVLFILGTVNAVNLTDGLDGLASSVTCVNAITYVMIFQLALQGTLHAYGGNAMESIDQIGNLMLVSAALAGACLGFLWFNSYPARVFMGDTGSMALGGTLCGLMIFSRSILMIFLVGIMFVCSAVSVILQVGSYKLRNKKRIFLMAPVHHHFELKGFPETKIVSGYTIVSIIGAAFTLLSFYLAS